MLRGKGDSETQGEHHVETGVTLPPSKKCLGDQKLEEAGRLLPHRFQRAPGLAHP